MDNQRPEYFRPALIAGAAAGVLMGVPFVNCLCCLWIIGGGVLATHLLARKTPGPLKASDGAIVGAITGMGAAVALSLMNIVMRPINEAILRPYRDNLPQLPDQAPAWLSGLMTWVQNMSQREATQGSSLAGFFLSLFFSAAILAILGLLGGVIGVSLFGRKKVAPPAVPEPPQGPSNAAL